MVPLRWSKERCVCRSRVLLENLQFFTERVFSYDVFLLSISRPNERAT